MLEFGISRQDLWRMRASWAEIRCNLTTANKDKYSYFNSQLSVWLAQLVKVLAAPTHCMCAVGPGSIPGADKLASGFYPTGIGKLRDN